MGIFSWIFYRPNQLSNNRDKLANTWIMTTIFRCSSSFITCKRQRNVQSINDNGLATSKLINYERVLNWSLLLFWCVPSSVVPCAPRNVSAVKECGADAITVTWISNGSAIFYVAMAKDSNGVIRSCNSMGLTCKIEGLKCSTNYTAYVIASNFMCNSSESEMVTIETGTVRVLLFLLLGY